jgi:hypothetical protein
MKQQLFATAIALALGIHLPAMAADSTKAPTDQEQIKGVIESFRTSVVNKDKTAFLKLFFNDNPPWIGVTSDKSLKMIKDHKKDPSQPDPVKIYSDDTPTKFIDGLIANPQHFEEKFSNIHIDTDGNVGLVYFDYSFNVGAYKANWGKESWHMVHTADGWKISSVVWSMDFNPEPPTGK